MLASSLVIVVTTARSANINYVAHSWSYPLLRLHWSILASFTSQSVFASKHSPSNTRESIHFHMHLPTNIISKRSLRISVRTFSPPHFDINRCTFFHFAKINNCKQFIESVLLWLSVGNVWKRASSFYLKWNIARAYSLNRVKVNCVRNCIWNIKHRLTHYSLARNSTVQHSTAFHLI